METATETSHNFNRIPPVILRDLKDQGEIRISEGEKTLAKFSVDDTHFIGQGDTAIILSGADEGGGKVAVKMCYPSDPSQKDIVTREFQREKDILSKVDHPNILKYFGSGVVHVKSIEIPVIVRELFPETLGEEIKEKKLNTQEAARLSKDIASGLEDLADNEGVIVTDLNPDNIARKEDGSHALCDLGLVAKKGSDQEVGWDEVYTDPGLKEGTNIELNEKASLKSTVYSLALVIYASLGGKMPETAIEIAMNIDKEKGVKIETIPGVSQRTFDVLLKGVRKEYETPSDLAKAFEESIKEDVLG